MKLLEKTIFNKRKLIFIKTNTLHQVCKASGRPKIGEKITTKDDREKWPSNRATRHTKSWNLKPINKNRSEHLETHQKFTKNNSSPGCWRRRRRRNKKRDRIWKSEIFLPKRFLAEAKSELTYGEKTRFFYLDKILYSIILKFQKLFLRSKKKNAKKMNC